jgi:hypothetical protein
MHSNLVRLPTLFPSHKEASRALILGIELLRGGTLQKDDLGFCLIEDLCKKIIEIDSTLRYLTRNHIIEFFFRDTDRKILISGVDQIKYKDIRYVCPPDILYFGTVENLVEKMREHGIRSNTKGYVKLYRTPEKACEFARKFAREGEKTAAIKIKAGGAFSDGLKFSTFLEDEYIVVQLNRKYLL